MAQSFLEMKALRPSAPPSEPVALFTGDRYKLIGLSYNPNPGQPIWLSDDQEGTIYLIHSHLIKRGLCSDLRDWASDQLTTIGLESYLAHVATYTERTIQ